jgi:hypothetical protein
MQRQETKANQPLRPSGFAPAFGRAVGPSARLFMVRVNVCPSDALAGVRTCLGPKKQKARTAVGTLGLAFMVRVNVCPSDAMAGARRGRAWIRKGKARMDSRGLRAGFMARVNVGLPMLWQGQGRARSGKQRRQQVLRLRRRMTTKKQKAKSRGNSKAKQKLR